MPANKSLNKVRATRLFGAGASVGLTDPKVHMQVKHASQTRWIKTLDSGNFQVGLALGSGGAVIAKAYPHDLTCSTGVASYFGWPASNTSTKFGHSGTRTSGTDDVTGMEYFDGDGSPTRFTR